MRFLLIQHFGAVVKSAGVLPQMLVHTGPAVIFESEPEAYEGIVAGKVTKTARVAGGYELKVPIFVNEGDWIRIDTRSGEYADRIMGRR